MHLFLLDQKAWVRIKYSPPSEKLCLIGNHSMAVASDNATYEKIMIFGGITNYTNPEVSNLTNQLFCVEIRQIM